MPGASWASTLRVVPEQQKQATLQLDVHSAQAQQVTDFSPLPFYHVNQPLSLQTPFKARNA